MTTEAFPADDQAHPRVFVRKATGLVREVSPFSTFVFNMAGQPTALLLAMSMFWTLGLFPGGNMYLALLFAGLVAISLALCYGLISSAIPRSGGDYVLVGRVTHPLVGVISSFMWIAGVMLVIGWLAQTFVAVGLAPSLAAVGLVNHSHTLVSWGGTLATSKWWQFGLGGALILFASALLAGGWKWYTRFLTTLWALMLVGLGAVAIVMLAHSHADFVSSFNRVAQPSTGMSDTYHHLLTVAPKQGVNTHPAFSLGNTVPMWAAVMSLTIYGWLSIYISGEVRRARSAAQPAIMVGATAFHVVVAALLTLVLFSRLGHAFFIAINGLDGTKAYPFSTPPYYTFLASITGGSAVLAWFLFVTFIVAFPLLMMQNMAVAVRSYFAWALDGLLPLRVARVDAKAHAPLYAVGLCTILGFGALVWAVTSASFFTVLAEAVLLQVTTMILLGVAAVLLPYRRREEWQGSATTRTILGVPLVAVGGVVSIVLMAVVGFLYLHYSAFGIDHTHFARDWGIVLAAAVVFYVGARAVRARQGVDVGSLTTEIPPE